MATHSCCVPIQWLRWCTSVRALLDPLQFESRGSGGSSLNYYHGRWIHIHLSSCQFLPVHALVWLRTHYPTAGPAHNGHPIMLFWRSYCKRVEVIWRHTHCFLESNILKVHLWLGCPVLAIWIFSWLISLKTPIVLLLKFWLYVMYTSCCYAYELMLMQVSLTYMRWIHVQTLIYRSYNCAISRK